jgi:PilZ domain
MFETILSSLQFEGEEKQIKMKRRHERREADHCVTVIGGKTYPVENWSPGGLLIFGDPRPFAVDAEVDVTMKFKLREEIMNVPHKAKVVRKTYDRVAFEFLPLSRQIKKGFQAVIDDFVTGQFADSQLV